MARRGVTGQLNMFDFFKALDENATGEVQMVSLMPQEEPEESQAESEESQVESVEATSLEIESPAKEEQGVSQAEEIPQVEEISQVEEAPQVEEIPQVEDVLCENTDAAVMSRQYEVDGEKIEIAYLNYNKVRICRGSKAPVIKEFSSSKEAVDYYVQQMQELEQKDED